MLIFHNMRNPSVIFFDYDGVILDSAFEKYCIALQALDKSEIESFHNKGAIDSYIKSIEYKNFKQLIPFIGDIGENALALILIRENFINFNDINRSKFIEIISHKKLMKNYNVECIQARNLFMSNAELYKKICPVFENVIKIIKKYSKNTDIEMCICSTKPYQNLIKLNKLFNLEDSFCSIKSIAGLESKIAYIDEYVSKSYSHYKKIIFIDDFVRHLSEDSNSDIVRVFADWGFDNEKPNKDSKIISASLSTLSDVIATSLIAVN